MKQYNTARKILALPLLGLIAALPFAFSGNAFAHGPPPTGCAMYYGLEYESEITSFIVDNGQQEYDVLANPEVAIPVTRDQQFEVRFTLHTDEQGFRMENGSKIEANSSEDAGYAWYRDFANGYPYSKCAGPVEGDTDFEITQDYPVSHMFQGEGPHLVFFETTFDDSRPKAEFHLHIVDDLTESTEQQETEEEQPEEEPEEEETILTPFIPDQDGTESASVDEGTNTTLTINGTLAALSFPAGMNNTFDAAPDVMVGDWYMTVNDTAVSDFQANITVISADSLARENYIVSNFTAINATAVQIEDNIISVASAANITTSEDLAQAASIVITIERLNAVRIDLDVPLGETPGPIYGIVDKLVISEDGEEIRVISR